MARLIDRIVYKITAWSAVAVACALQHDFNVIGGVFA